MKGQILLVDDEEIVLRSCQRILRGEDYEIDVANDGLMALGMLAEKDYDVLVLDIMMPKMDGIEVLRRVKESRPDIEVLMITGLNEIGTAVKAMKLGAFDYLQKPFPMQELETQIRRAFERRQLRKENRQLRALLERSQPQSEMIGQSQAMQEVFRTIGRLSRSDISVLITGETGSGKEVVARA